MESIWMVNQNVKPCNVHCMQMTNTNRRARKISTVYYGWYFNSVSVDFRFHSKIGWNFNRKVIFFFFHVVKRHRVESNIRYFFHLKHSWLFRFEKRVFVMCMIFLMVSAENLRSTWSVNAAFDALTTTQSVHWTNEHSGSSSIVHILLLCISSV